MSYISLRWSTIRIVTLAFSGLLIVAIVLFYGVTQNRFLSLERTTAEQSINLVRQTISATRRSYVSKVEDWAFWDDTSSYIDTLDPAYQKSNLGQESAATIGVESIMFLDRGGNIRSEHFYSANFEPGKPIREAISALTGPHGIVQKASSEERTISGFISNSDVLAFVAAAPILKSDRTGPAKGSVIFVKIVDAKLLDSMRATSQRQFTLWSSGAPDLPEDVRMTAGKVLENSSLIDQSESATMRSYAAVEDLWGKQSVLFRIDEHRPIYREGQQTLLTALALLIGSAVVFAGVLVYLIEHHVLGRILSLGRQLRAIHESKDLTAKVSLDGNDEIRELAGIVNFLLTTIESSCQDLEQSRDQMYVQSLRFAEQVERLTKSRDTTAARERDVTNLLRTVVVQLRDTLSSSTGTMQGLSIDEIPAAHRQSIAMVRKTLDQVQDIMKETEAAIDTTKVQRLQQSRHSRV